jgi:hypothetical protein
MPAQTAKSKEYTRSQYEQWMAGGGSVILDGQHYEKASELPGDAELSGNDPEAIQAAIDSAERDINSRLAELHKLRNKSAQAPESGRELGPNPAQVNRPLVAGPVPQEGPVQPAPLDLRPGAHLGDGHDPDAQPEPVGDFPTGHTAGNPRMMGPSTRPGGVSGTKGTPPPDPRLNSADAHTYRRSNKPEDPVPTEDEEERAGAGVKVPRSVQELLAGLSDDQKARLRAEAEQAQAKGQVGKVTPAAPGTDQAQEKQEVVSGTPAPAPAPTPAPGAPITVSSKPQ